LIYVGTSTSTIYMVCWLRAWLRY